MFSALGKYTYSYRKWIVAASVVVFLLAVVFGTGAIDRLKPGDSRIKTPNPSLPRSFLKRNLARVSPISLSCSPAAN